MELKDNCGICRISMIRNVIKRLLPCRHLLHARCIEGLQSRACPICRTNIEEEVLVVRKKYERHTNQDMERIVVCANRGEDWVSLAASLGIKYKTAFHWVSLGKERILEKGGSKRKLNEDEVDAILLWLEEDCSLTLKQLKLKVLHEFGKDVCTTTIGNYLDGRMYTTKKVHNQSVSMNTHENKLKRAEYVNALNNYIQTGKQIVWIDETNFNMFCRRSVGRSKKGTRAIQILPASRGQNVHLIGAMSAAGIISMERKHGSFRAQSANDWLTTVLASWQDLGNQLKDLVIVCDNAPCHSRLEDVVNTTPATLLRLGPYSPMLNPIVYGQKSSQK